MFKKISEISIACLTYNHVCFIEAALSSFLNQKIDVDYNIYIFDGGSADGTRQILLDYQEKYPDKINLIFPEIDPGATNSFYSLLDSCTGKFIAICEGDDYWIDEYKLHKQYKLLEGNSDIGLVHSDIDYLYNETKKLIVGINCFHQCHFEKCNEWQKASLVEDIILGNYIIRTPTVMIRSTLYRQIRADMSPRICCDFQMADTPLWIEFAKISKLFYLQDSMAVYRINKGSVSNPNDFSKLIRFRLSSAEYRLYYSLNNILSTKLNRKIRRSYCLYFELYRLYNPKYKSKFPEYNVPCYYNFFINIFGHLVEKRLK